MKLRNLAAIGTVGICFFAAIESSPQIAVEAWASSKLGDLSKFRVIAVDVKSLVEKGDLPAAKTRIKDLELEWDKAEAGIKPRAAKDWHKIDKAIDRALGALRDSHPEQAKCKKTISEVVSAIDSE